MGVSEFLCVRRRDFSTRAASAARCRVNRLDRCSQRLAIRPACVVEAVADQMHDAGLQRGCPAKWVSIELNGRIYSREMRLGGLGYYFRLGRTLWK